MSQNNLNAVITGGGSGIGLAIATKLAEAGINLALMGRNKDRLEAAIKNLPKYDQQKFYAISVDLRAAESVREAFKQSSQELGEANILVNNAGIVNSNPITKISLEDWEQEIAVNLTGAFLCMQAVLPSMIKANYGRIVSISSTAGLTGYPYVSAYCASKHGLIGLTKSVALEVVNKGVTVNAVCPGYTDTELIDNSINKIMQKTGDSKADLQQKFVDKLPLGRFIKPEEVASTVAWLCSEEQAAITGQTITIAGAEIL